jgi:hypothetical protein
MIQRDGGIWPDDARFTHVIGNLLTRARWGGTFPPRSERGVRAFGEMVAVLWAQGCTGATVYLEHLWNRLRDGDPEGVDGRSGFPLFCAYPRIGTTQDALKSMHEICACHTQVITN